MRNSWILQVLLIGRAINIYHVYNILLCHLRHITETGKNPTAVSIMVLCIVWVSSKLSWLLCIALTTVYYLNQSAIPTHFNISDFFPYLFSPWIPCLHKYFCSTENLIRFLIFWKLISDLHDFFTLINLYQQRFSNVNLILRFLLLAPKLKNVWQNSLPIT